MCENDNSAFMLHADGDGMGKGKHAIRPNALGYSIGKGKEKERGRIE